jgi:tetratricopeptide (TPR) repeat protein
MLFDLNGSIAVRHVRYLPRQGEALAFVLTRDSRGVGNKLRFWLRKEDNRWRIFDFEELSSNVRATTYISLLTDSRRIEAIDAVLDHFNAVLRAILAEDFVAARGELQKISDTPHLPAQFRAAIEILWAIVLRADREFEQALTRLATARKLSPDAPILDLMRAEVLIELGRYDDARADAERFLNLLGADDEGFRVLGDSLAGLNRKREAADAYRKSLDEFAGNLDSLIGLANVLPKDQMQELGDRFTHVEMPRDHFATLASALEKQANWSALEAIVAAYRALAADDAEIGYYEDIVEKQRHEVVEP